MDKLFQQLCTGFGRLYGITVILCLSVNNVPKLFMYSNNNLHMLYMSTLVQACKLCNYPQHIAVSHTTSMRITEFNQNMSEGLSG
jgi:hypothetical protein